MQLDLVADRFSSFDETLPFLQRQYSFVDQTLDFIDESVQIIQRRLGFILVQVLDCLFHREGC